MPREKQGKEYGRDLKSWNSNRPDARAGKLRIIGGKYRGRQLLYSGDSRTRPMKDNIREAVFNLVGGWLKGKHVIDLFAGTGAIGLEALSRGASHVTLIERHFPTAKVIRDNIASLKVESETTILTSDTFFWSRKFIAGKEPRPTQPWVVFCSPPYSLYVERLDDLMTMITGLIEVAPPESIFVIESDDRFDPKHLPRFNSDETNTEDGTNTTSTPDSLDSSVGDDIDGSARTDDKNGWRIRKYSPAQVCVLRGPASNRP